MWPSFTIDSVILKMMLDGFKPDKFMLICILNSYNDDGFVYCGRLNVVACSFMILGYADKAIQLFKEMRKHGDTTK